MTRESAVLSIPGVAPPAPAGAGSGTRQRLVLSHALAALGMSMPWPVLLDLAWEQSGSGFMLGLVGAARMLPYVLCSWWVASLADRFGRRRVLGLTLWSRILLLGAAAWVIGAGGAVGGAGGQTAGLAWAIVLATLAVACGTPAYPALVASMPAAGPGNGRRATALLVTVEVSSFVVGPALGGLVLGRWSPAMVLLAGACLTAGGLALIGRVRLPHVDSGPTAAAAAGAESESAEISTDLPTKVVPLLRRSVRVRGAIAAICVMNLVDASLLVALVPIADGRWGIPTAYGQATAAFGFGALAAPALFWLGRTPTRQVHLGMALFAVALCVLVPLSALVLVLLLLGVSGAASVHVEAAATELLQSDVPDRVRAHVLGVTDALMVGAAMIGSFVGPVLVEAVGGSASLAVLAIVTVVAGALVLPVVRHSATLRGSSAVEAD